MALRRRENLCERIPCRLQHILLSFFHPQEMIYIPYQDLPCEACLSQISDIQEVFLDSFLTVSYVDTNEGFTSAMNKLDKICNNYDVKFVISVSKDEKDLPESAKGKIVVSL